MKKFTLLLLFIFTAYLGYAQQCGSYIELIGIGITGESGATLTIEDPESVVKIIVEAVHKSGEAPTTITFSTPSQTKNVEPLSLGYSGIDPSDYEPATSASVYRTTLGPAETVSVDVGSDPGFFSFAAHIFRKPDGITSSLVGELYHVFQNGGDPLVLEIPVSTADDPRDIRVKFGVTELNPDARYAIFRLMASDGTEEGYEEIREINIHTWGEDEKDSYTIQEVLFEEVPGGIDKIEMTLISPVYPEGEAADEDKGDSFIAGVTVVDVPCEEYEPSGYCTYTQGFYGNEGGKTCAGETTRELLTRLLVDDIEMGEGENTFTIPAGAVDCVLDILPGGGPPAVLSGASSCDDMGNVPTKRNGTIRNILLAQGITLTLNLANSPGLLDFPIDGEPFIIRQTEDCTDPESEGIPGTEQEHQFNQEIADYLGEGATIIHLLDLVNDALGGEDISPLSLSQVSDAAAFVNETFDECVVVLGEAVVDASAETGEEDNDDGDDDGDDEGDDEGEKGQAGTKGTTGITDIESNPLGIYPNPVMDQFFISLPSEVKHVKAAAIYNMNGLLMKTIKDQVDSRGEQAIGIKADDLIPGMYFIRVDTDTGTLIQRFGVQ